ncbi:uncharacterized protein MONOS_4958 [Monocercomonoides exilis]|uniref:uncharacterized protein n=1 Tax=Monocercomonoides exilis TaxID=2049356 RepID=UPI003559E921|nr:hypothetical protein MONOS_4958 [Monocercomonoides exilis]|eukprot:MONOS_4958.1-p1 / transcript=MONOS_4958.1 / gene=MONOS_4958 / organism=Monocercomonoides_exilis_PA203 / gene_product=unspecified product / transcript_product=unspecified product / location=Mono_scaffold00139:20836-21387(+) / protein_length=184 / sequence_SO=supercontig / SO=protein_coding / is_pseudo=false
MKHGPCVITFTVEQKEIDTLIAGWNYEMSVLGENDNTAENANAFTPNSKDANEKITRSVTVLGWGVSPLNSKDSSEIEYWLVKDQEKLEHSSDSAVDYYADASTASLSDHFEATSNSVPLAIRDTYRVAISSKLSTKDHLAALFFSATVETRGDVGGSFHVNIPHKISIVLGLILLLFSSSLL